MTVFGEIAAVTTPGSDPNSRLRGREFLLVSFVAHTIMVFLHFTYLWLDDLVRQEVGTFWPRLIEESTGGYGAFLFSWFVYLVWRAVPLRGPHLVRRIPLYVGLGILLSAANTTFMWGSRSLIFPLVGLGPYDYGLMPLRYLMELPASLIGFTILLAVLALIEEIRERRERRRVQAELSRALVASQLQNLRLQLQPHFLFNALNTIAAQVHDNPVNADALLGRLADLLRASLRANDVQQLPLADELALLGAYSDLMIARFGDRLVINVHVEPGTEGLLVPPLLLQPLVENAVRHGGLESDGHAVVRVGVARHDGHLTFTVHDDGPGVPRGQQAITNGTGLSTTARRLELLYGANAELVAANDPEGGFLVTVTVPVSVPVNIPANNPVNIPVGVPVPMPNPIPVARN